MPKTLEEEVCKVHLPGAASTGKTGWLYVFDTGHRDESGIRVFKIGRAHKPREREQALRAGNPFGELLFAAYLGGRVGKYEKMLHQYFAARQVERECFSLTNEDLAYIKRTVMKDARDTMGDL